MNLSSVVERATANTAPNRQEAFEMLSLADTDTLALVEAAWQVRRHFHGTRVKVNVLVNARSGACAEDCHYCSQSRVSDADIPKYSMISANEIIERARAAHAAGADRLCIVTSNSGADWPVIEQVEKATKQIKAEFNLSVCASLGFIDEAKAQRLKQAGVDAYNHNLNTSQQHYGEICSTHGYERRVSTVEVVRQAGLAPCSGVIIGMGESVKDVVEMAFTLREIGAASIPVNFLIPIDGTPVGDAGHADRLSPWYCLRVLSLFRLVNPQCELRASAGREYHLRSLQPLALMVANSIFLGDYLTEPGQNADADWAMLADLGLDPETSKVDKVSPLPAASLTS